ncbi:OLC1v1029376C1 [Oldenlandia corymbosa var. corymbosa]|uniref:OLC1v1029376C1 n=1 Tax=Oldenlandia corymbosa var. corymbosa TaxID=529605 RepID=A0AAV1CF84_OLDCO|nr:OLC1v1029376C1 [Oldenlandia corymbosa var. corymbosa]
MDGGGAPVAHPAVRPISFLLGNWKGEGEGGFPTISAFRYGEELCFSHHPSKPVMAYSQKTWKLDSGEPMHGESGYWRPKPDGSIEVVIAQSTGLVEVQKGTFDSEEKIVRLKSTVVGNASKVKEINREFKVDDDGGELSYVVEMATNNVTPSQPHLKASLKKI